MFPEAEYYAQKTVCLMRCGQQEEVQLLMPGMSFRKGIRE